MKWIKTYKNLILNTDYVVKFDIVEVRKVVNPKAKDKAGNTTALFTDVYCIKAYLSVGENVIVDAFDTQEQASAAFNFLLDCLIMSKARYSNE